MRNIFYFIMGLLFLSCLGFIIYTVYNCFHVENNENAVRDSVLEYINIHPDIDIIQLQYWKGDKWYAFLTFYEYTK